MATAELRTFIEDRLRALDTSLDLSPGSPAQTEFIDPVIEYLGTDPFETDIDKFLTDRLSQEYPDIFAGDPSAYRDLFIKPLILFLEPFKRETQSLKRGQSLRDPAQLSDDDADALVANWFDSRNKGGYAKGAVRIYFSNPANVQVDLNTRFYTADGKSFYPETPSSVTAEEMVFNRQGSLYFTDIQVRAESVGASFNIDAEQVVGVVGLFGVVKVTNLRPISDGSDSISTEALIAQTEASLTERSLTNPRGITARVRDVFKGDVRGVQAIGARDPEMQRDYLVGTSSGDTWATGDATFYGSLVLVQTRWLSRADQSATPKVGDKIVIWAPSWNSSVVTVEVAEVLTATPFAGGTGFGPAHLLRWSGTMPHPSDGLTFQAGLVRNTTITIASPDAIPSDIVVESGKVHVYGRTDVYVRPTTVVDSKVVLSALVDESPLIEADGLVTAFDDGFANRFKDPAVNFEDEGVRADDVLLIETGELAGTYRIIKVDGSYLVLPTVILKAVSTPMRYRIVRSITLRLFDPKIPKLPFGDTLADDLQTQIGSNLVQVGVNVAAFGVLVGDTLRILDGQDAGDYVIEALDASLGGRGLLLDRKVTASAGGLAYEIFAPLESVERPLIRLKELALLDTAKKATGVQIPPADPVAVVPVGEFTTARHEGDSHLRSGYVLPDLSGYVYGTSVAAAAGQGNDRRYSLGIDSDEGGTYKAVSYGTASEGELLFPPDAFGSCSYFMATVEDAGASLPAYEDPRPGEALTIKDGPNKGSYLIKQVRKFKYLAADDSEQWVYFIKIHGTFPVDVFRHLITFLDANLVSAIPKIDWMSAQPFPGIFTAFYAGLGASLHAAITGLAPGSAPPTAETLQAVVESMTSVRYSWGKPAHGILRTLFQQPTLFEQRTDEAAAPTVFEYRTASGEVVAFRPEPGRYKAHPILPAMGASETDVLAYPRDVRAPTVGGGTSTLEFSSSDKPTMLALGVVPGDEVAVHAFVSEAGVPVVRTAIGSPIVRAKTGTPFSESMAGNLLFIEEGPDAGGYVVDEVLDPQTLVLNKALSTSSPEVLKWSGNASWGWNGTDNVIEVPATEGAQDNVNFFNGLVGKWVTLSNVPSDPDGTYWMGSYEILSVYTVGGSIRGAIVGRTGQFPTVAAGAHIMVTDAPSAAPSVVGDGTETVAGVPVRLYRDTAETYPITAVGDDGSASNVTVQGTVTDSYGCPYSVLRPNIRRVCPQEMEQSAFGPFFYCDTTVVSLTAVDAANLKLGAYLTVKDGTYRTAGYRHRVEDPSLSYSTRENGFLELPVALLPTFSDDRRDNELSTLGTPVQITYEKSDLVERLQAFLDSGEDRSTAGDLLARHFLPSYVTYEAAYIGGSATAVVAKDIIDLINTLTIESPLDVSQIQELISRRGGNPVTPTTVSVLVHDWERRAWAEFSQNQIGPGTAVPYAGTPRVTFYIPGKDVSGQLVVPYGERIKLVRS